MQNKQNFNMQESEVYKKVNEVIDRNKASDLFHKAFLRPQEVALKTWRTEKDLTKPHDALPYGLKQAIKKDISLNQYILKDFQSFDALDDKQKSSIAYVTDNNYDNLISLIKPKSKQEKIKLCICICMYSQQKSMLRKTLAGVSKNIATFLHNGVSPDDIVVAVMVDGIQKVDPSVVDFFGQLEKQSNIYLDDDVQALDQKEVINDNLSQVDEQEIININNFIFDLVQMADRKKRRFAQRKREYELVKKMGKIIESLQKKQLLTYYDLDDFLKDFYIDKAREDKKKNGTDPSLGIDKITDDQIVKEYGQDIVKSKPIITRALSDAKFYCEKYIQTRDNLALLNSYRVEVNCASFENKRKKSKQEKYENLNEEYIPEQPVKMNLLFITKYKNSGKLSSHNWFFNGLCRQIRCQYSVLLDVGLCPEKTAIFRMYKHMQSNQQCGGVCGYMNLRIERLEDEDQAHKKHIDCLSRLFLHFVDIQRAQQIQYHFAHLIDKPFQALFKFIHVLPGAFSAYRTHALECPRGQPFDFSRKQDSKLMRQYFKSLDESTSQQLIKTEYTTGKAILKVVFPDFLFNCIYPSPNAQTDQQLLYDSNVYLAEDRTLCMGIHQNDYNLDYLPDAHAWVDPIKHLHGLLGQRKRWINGSFFAFQSVKKEMKNSRREMHGEDCCLKLQIFYLNLMNIIGFVAPAIFMFTIHIAMSAFRDWFFGTVLQDMAFGELQTSEFYSSFIYVMDFIYIMLMLAFIFKSMHFTHRTEKFIPFAYIMSTIMGIFSVIVLIVLISDMIQGIIDSYRCYRLANPNDCQITFLAENPILREKFFTKLPGQLTTFLIYKWVVVGVVFLYSVPIVIYASLYCKWQFLMDVIFGVVSFVFYTPTYLNMLNTFALCRIDDISWGTKGLDAEVSKGNNLKDAWKAIKIMYVAKFVFWNILVGTAMLIISSPLNVSGALDAATYQNLLVDSYIRKFFMTFALMIIIGFALFLKIIIGAMYIISYRVGSSVSSKSILKQHEGIKNDSKVQRYFEIVKPSMDQQLKQYIGCMVGDLKATRRPIKMNRVNEIAEVSRKLKTGKKRAQEKWKKTVQSKSKVQKLGDRQKRKKPSMGKNEKQDLNKSQHNNRSFDIHAKPKNKGQPEKPNKNSSIDQSQNGPNKTSKNQSPISHDQANQGKNPPGPHNLQRSPSPSHPRRINQDQSKDKFELQKKGKKGTGSEQISSEAFLIPSP